MESKIPTLESRLTSEEIDLAQQKQIAKSKLQSEKTRLSELSELLAAAKRFVADDLERFNSSVSKINSLLRELGIDGNLPNLGYPAADLASVTLDIESKLTEVVAQIEHSEKELHSYEAQVQDHAKYLNRRAELAARRAVVDERLQALATDAQRLADEMADRDRLLGDLLRTVLEQRQRYAEIIEIFSSQKAEVLSDLDFRPQVQFNRKMFLGGLADVLDNRQIDVFGDEDKKIPSRFEPLLQLYERLASGDAEAVGDIVRSTADFCHEMKGKIKPSQAIDTRSLYKCMYGRYLNVVPVVRYKGTALNKLSLGQKATVLIKIHLAQGTNPIIIDSHDDHLDNEFIMDELVGAIRKAKTYRQIILASNNGNVVINSDAEQIVIANRDDTRISYVSGSIENPAIRDRALQVLEGGVIAFKKRQEKYRIEQ